MSHRFLDMKGNIAPSYIESNTFLAGHAKTSNSFIQFGIQIESCNMNANLICRNSEHPSNIQYMKPVLKDGRFANQS